MTIDKTTKGGAKTKPSPNAPSTGFATDVLPEAQKSDLTKNSKTGVSTKNVQLGSKVILSDTQSQEQHWYALRTTYGREKKAYEYIIANNGTAFYPTIKTDKLVKGRRKTVEVSRLPNIFFAYGTEEEIKRFVYDNVHLPFLRFYYRHYNKGNIIEKEPLIVPDKQMESLQIVCSVDEDTIVTTEIIHKFELGTHVHIILGPFSGVEGVVSRYKGQQRVGVTIEGIGTIITAYVPTAYIQESINY